jgi:shikimate dehydrogenase
VTKSWSEKRSFVLGLVGSGIGASLTPALQEREGREAGLSLTYRLIDLDRHGMTQADLAEVLAWARRLGFDGLNITHPFKQAVVPLLDDLSEDARDLGAVNTIVFRDGLMLGRNTDWSGYSRAFQDALPEAIDDRALLLGAGGAGAAVGYGLLRQGATHVAILDPDLDKAKSCVERLTTRFGDQRVSIAEDLEDALGNAQGLVNATPIGMHGHPGTAVPAGMLRSDLWVSDIVYFPLQTALVAAARSRGCRVLSGGGMAVHQAVGAFEYFTGRAAEAARMSRHFLELTA